MPGFKEVKPVVFSSIYPVASDDYQSLLEALEKYKLNDASLTYQKDSSAALGQGFRCGYSWASSISRSCRRGWRGSSTSPS